MIKLFSKGVYLINNKEIIEDCNDINLILKNKNDLVSINYLCENTKKSVREVTNILFALEIEGKIKKSMGGYKCT